MANEPEAIPLSTLPSCTSQLPSYNSVPEPPKALTFTPIEKSVYEPPAAVSSPIPQPEPAPSPWLSRLRESLKHAMPKIRKLLIDAVCGSLLVIYISLHLAPVALIGVGLWLAFKDK